MEVTPGVTFVASGLLKLAIPSISVYVARYFLGTNEIPAWAFNLAAVLVLPVLVSGTIIWQFFAEQREAAAMGAQVVPIWKGTMPGSVDLLLKFIELAKNGYPGEGFLETYEALGPIYNFRILWSNRLFTIQPEHIKAILATEFNNYEKGSVFSEHMNSVLGTGVFNSDGEMWKFHRSMTRPFFSRDRISHFDIFERHTDEVITLMKERLRAGYAIDFQDVVSRFTLDSATEFLFGSCVNSLHDGLPYPHNAPESIRIAQRQNRKSADNSAEEFAAAFSEAQFAIAQRSRMGSPWALWEVLEDKTKKPMEVVNRYLEPILKDALRKKAEGKTKQGPVKDAEIEDGDTLLDLLVRYTDDTTILRDEILNIMIAGRDTTAATLTFAVYLMSQSPKVLQKLRAEILEKVGPSQRPTYDDIKDMKYLRAVINETLRLFPAVPFNVRDSIKSATFAPVTPGGKRFYVPAKTSVFYSVFMMHRRKDLWGPDALEFDPDRFLDERLHKYLTPNPFIFLPFNAGPRICLGQQFAYNEASFMLIRLLQNFDGITLDEMSQPPESKPPAYWSTMGGRQALEKINPKSHLTIYTVQGLWVKMKEASN